MKFAEVLVQKLEEKKKSLTMRYLKAKIDPYCISIDLRSFTLQLNARKRPWMCYDPCFLRQKNGPFSTLFFWIGWALNESIAVFYVELLIGFVTEDLWQFWEEEVAGKPKRIEAILVAGSICICLLECVALCRHVIVNSRLPCRSGKIICLFWLQYSLSDRLSWFNHLYLL